MRPHEEEYLDVTEDYDTHGSGHAQPNEIKSVTIVTKSIKGTSALFLVKDMLSKSDEIREINQVA